MSNVHLLRSPCLLALAAWLGAACGGQADRPSLDRGAAPTTPAGAGPASERPTTSNPEPPVTQAPATPAAEQPAEAVELVPEPPGDEPEPPVEPPEPQPVPTEPVPTEPVPSEPVPPAEPPTPTNPPSPIHVEGCTQIGGYDRVALHQRDASSGICTDFVLRSPSDDAPVSPNLSLPAGWAVDEMSAYACTTAGVAMSGTTPTHFSRADGSVAFSGNAGGLPAEVQVDVSLSAPLTDPPVPANQLILTQRLRANDVGVSRGCAPRG